MGQTGSGHGKFVGIASIAAVGMTLVLALVFGSAPSRAAYTVQTGITYAEGSPANPALNQLDLYRPTGEAEKPRPVVVWIHGGGWRVGDKKNRMTNKARLFTDAGYIVASINYRLSPSYSSVPTYLPDRIMYPDHPHDVAAALSWISGNIDDYGGDPDALILLGHSAGAHLVSLAGSDASWLESYGDSLKQILGVVSLDAGALDVVDSATQTSPQPTANNYLIWNAFGNPSEEGQMPRWFEASPVTWGDPGDPRSLLVTQASKALRIIDNQKMATALGQDPASVLTEPLDHVGINRALGDPNDTTGETQAVMAFIAGRIASRADPRASIRKRPAKVVRVGRKRGGKLKQRQVRFAFAGSGVTEGFQCRLDKARFKTCVSPRKFWAGGGNHTFRVRPLYPSGRPGTEKVVKFRVKAKSKKAAGHSRN